jgi:hypothetical protein
MSCAGGRKDRARTRSSGNQKRRQKSLGPARRGKAACGQPAPDLRRWRLFEVLRFTFLPSFLAIFGFKMARAYAGFKLSASFGAFAFAWKAERQALKPKPAISRLLCASCGFRPSVQPGRPRPSRPSPFQSKLEAPKIRILGGCAPMPAGMASPAASESFAIRRGAFAALYGRQPGLASPAPLDFRAHGYAPWIKHAPERR